VYEEARERHPRRWSKGIREWSLPVSVWLNPVKKAESEMSQTA
jgi:putative transposase